MGKQADRRANKKAAKPDDEPAAANATSGTAILDAVKQLALGSVMVEFAPMLPRLLRAESAVSAKDSEAKAQSEEKKDDEDTAADEQTNEDTPAGEKLPTDAPHIFESLIVRLSIFNPLGLDKTPEVGWLLFKGLEIDFGPHKRKKGNAAMERIMVNMERNMCQYLHILLALICLRAWAFRSWFACLPLMVGFQLLSLNLPIDLIKEILPQMPEIDSKYRVVASLGIHGFVWMFFMYEFLRQTYFLEKFPLLGLFIIHAYIAAPEVSPEAARKTISDEREGVAKATSEAPAGKSYARDIIVVVKLLFSRSVLAKRSPLLLTWAKEMRASSSTKSSKDAGTEEKKADNGEETSKDGDAAKSSGASEIFDDLIKDFSYNILGLGLPATQELRVNAWTILREIRVDFSRLQTCLSQSKVKELQDGIMMNLARNMPEYLHIVLVMMCLRSFLFRSFFACLPWLVGYQFLSLHLPLDMIRAKFPQVPPVDFKLRVAVTMVVHSLMWFFFVYEIVFKLHLFGYVLSMGLILAHALVVNPGQYIKPY